MTYFSGWREYGQLPSRRELFLQTNGSKPQIENYPSWLGQTTCDRSTYTRQNTCTSPTHSISVYLLVLVLHSCTYLFEGAFAGRQFFVAQLASNITSSPQLGLAIDAICIYMQSHRHALAIFLCIYSKSSSRFARTFGA